MDDQQARKVNEAAEKFAQSLTEAYQALADRSVSAQELNAHLTQSFFNRVIENLGTQAESNRTLAGNLIEQQRKQQEASQTLARESVDAYMEFLGSVFGFPRQGTRVAEQAAIPDPNAQSGEEADATQDDATHHPLRSWMQTTETATSPPGEEQTPEEEPPTAREDPPGKERPSRRTL